MKQLKFESNNKQWLVVDLPKEHGFVFAMKFNHYGEDKFEALHSEDCNKNFSYISSCKLSEITEEQAIEVVKKLNSPWVAYNDYSNNFGTFDTAIESLHSLLKSKGVDNTWINPVIFEVVQ